MVRKEDLDFELKYLRYRNKNLAKALTDEKLLTKHYLEEKNKLQKKLHSAMVLNLRYKEIMKRLDSYSKETLTNVVAISQDLTKIIKLSNDAVQMSNNLSDTEEQADSPSMYKSSSLNCTTSTSNKTRIVQPMISGHVILRPTINLRRLSDSFSVDFRASNQQNELNPLRQEEIQANINCNNNTLSCHIMNWEPISGLDSRVLVENEDLSINNEDNSVDEPDINEAAETSDIILPQELHTVLEVNEDDEDEDEPELDITISPIRGDSFREARVIISPLPTTTEKEKDNKSKIKPKSPFTVIQNKSGNYDPLEGPSTLLTDVNIFRKYYSDNKRNSLNRQSSDSSSGDEWKPSSSPKRRKKLTKKDSKSKSNEIETNNTSKQLNASQPVVVLTQLKKLDLGKTNSHDAEKENNSEENLHNKLESANHSTNNLTQMSDSENSSIDFNISSRGSRTLRSRENVKSFKEVSLRVKLRRGK